MLSNERFQNGLMKFAVEGHASRCAVRPNDFARRCVEAVQPETYAVADLSQTYAIDTTAFRRYVDD